MVGVYVASKIKGGRQASRCECPAQVFEGTWQGTDVAIKVLEVMDERTLLDACHEFGYLHSLRHAKLVQSFGACVEVGPPGYFCFLGHFTQLQWCIITRGIAREFLYQTDRLESFLPAGQQHDAHHGKNGGGPLPCHCERPHRFSDQLPMVFQASCFPLSIFQYDTLKLTWMGSHHTKYVHVSGSRS